MILCVRDQIGKKVVTQQGEMVGDVDRIVFEGNKLKVYALIVKPRLGRLQLVYFDEIVDILYDGIIISDKSELKSMDKITRQIVDRSGWVIGSTAITEDKKNLGKVQDIYFHTVGGDILRFYIRKLFKELIIPVNYLVVITPRAVVFKDTVKEPIFSQEPSIADAISKP